ncbi:hypothetical protein G7046_g9283 [Stylonectria norvegica]|nr:hypothetical protein G7046_g9283 [Stylonectria norvegica]
MSSAVSADPGGRSMESRTGRNNQREFPWAVSALACSALLWFVLLRAALRCSSLLGHPTCLTFCLSTPLRPYPCDCLCLSHITSRITPSPSYRPCSTGAAARDPLTFPPYIGYNTKGERLVAGIVPLSADQNYVLMIQSTRRKGWVLPKGGWELDETCQEAAAREAWEEAGITLQINYDLGEIDEKRPHKSSKDRSRYQFFEGTVTGEAEDWPERHKRERQWFTFTQAWETLSSRPELQEALARSTINRL